MNEHDAQVYLMILRLGRMTFPQTVDAILSLVTRQTRSGFAPPRSGSSRVDGLAIFEQHPALKEYRRFYWRGWRIDYDLTPKHFSVGQGIIMRRGERTHRILFRDR